MFLLIRQGIDFELNKSRLFTILFRTFLTYHSSFLIYKISYYSQVYIHTTPSHYLHLKKLLMGTLNFTRITGKVKLRRHFPICHKLQRDRGPSNPYITRNYPRGPSSSVNFARSYLELYKKTYVRSREG